MMSQKTRSGRASKQPDRLGYETPAPPKSSQRTQTPVRAIEMSFATPAAQGTNTVRNRKKTPMSAVNEESESPFQANGHANGHANGPANGPANGDANGHANGDAANGHAKDSQPIVIDGWKEGEDPKIDHSGHFEFGGSFGTSLLMVGFPCLMYYMWIGATYYDGGLPLPKNQTIPEFFAHLGHLVLEGAWPSPKAWLMYWGFFIFEAACYIYLPGIWLTGRPLPHEGGKQLNYYCSAVWSFYVTIAMAVVLHVSGIFKLYTIIDEFGPLLSVAILSGFLVSIVAFISALYRGAQHRMTGHLIYDFFMGAELNPRLFGILDFKMFFEVRLPWYILLLLSMGTAARQYELYGYVSGEVCFLVMAHFLYANACSKGEECIVSTWDMYYEKWGFMLIFWNLAGVPLSYCHCTIYLANHHPDTYRWNPYALTALFVAYLFVYWVWDTANSQKNRFRQRERGTKVFRKAFPQLPWQTLPEHAKKIKTPQGTILIDGWYGLARKVHYTCDLYFALNWGLITGFKSPFPWFYPLFFACMISHRCLRDIQRCRLKYGDAWTEYEQKVPYLFIPYVI